MRNFVDFSAVFRASSQPTSLAPLQHVHASSLKGL
jgi:hypothetical protein